MKKDLLVLRANQYSPACHQLLLQAQRTGRVEALVVADTRRRRFRYEGLRQVEFSQSSVRALGLPTRGDMQWRCGDYAYYLALAAQPDFRHLWLVETDLRLCFDDIGEFFALFEDCPADYLTSGLRPADPDWSWTPHVASLRPTAYRSFFPLTRISRQACAHLFEQRRRQDQALANDESFTATILVNDGFDCRELDSVAPGLYASPGYSFDRPVLDRAYERLANTRQIYHPVLPDRLYLKRLRRYHGFPGNWRIILEEACKAYDVPPRRLLRQASTTVLSAGAALLLAIVVAFNNPAPLETAMQVAAILMMIGTAALPWRERLRN